MGSTMNPIEGNCKANVHNLLPDHTAGVPCAPFCIGSVTGATLHLNAGHLHNSGEMTGVDAMTGDMKIIVADLHSGLGGTY